MSISWLPQCHRQMDSRIGLLHAVSKEADVNDASIREEVIRLYPERKRWRKRVEQMPMGQVLAIYRDHQADQTPKPQAYYVNLDWESLADPQQSMTEPRDPHWNEDDFPIY